MPISSCHQLDITCEQCGVRYTFEVWLVVDVTERPDLLAACRNGSIHTASCPKRHVVYIGAPLLIHDPARKLVLFSPPLSPMSPAEERQMVSSLIHRLNISVPASVAHEDYLKRVRRVKRDELPRELDQPPKTARGEGVPDAEILNLFSGLSRPVGANEVPRQIQLCEEALRRYSGPEHEQMRGWLYAKLGTFLANCTSGEPAENLERSIEARKLALTVFTRDEDPLEWAKLQVNLGNVYLRRIRGSRAENAALAAECYRNALKVFTREQYPEDWGRVQANLKATVAEDAVPDTSRGPVKFRPEGSGASLMTQIDEAMATGDMPRLVKLCNLMLQIVRPETHARQWAQLQYALGYGLVNNPEGELTANVEQGVKAFEASLRYAGRASDVERVIEAYKAALSLHRLDTSPKSWADIQFNLGLAYEARAGMATDAPAADAVRESSLELAIEAYRAALEVRTRDYLPFEWACTLVNLGLAYRTRLRGSPDQNLEESRHALESALSVLTRQDHPREWAIAQYNLGETYRNRLAGDRPENQDRAVAAFENARQVFTREQFPFEWANVQIGLGDVYREHEQGDRCENSAKAVRAYEAALTVVDRATNPFQWARLQTLRGNSYVELDYAEVHPERARAAEAYEAALTVLTPENSPELWADAQHNLGSFLVGWKGGGDCAENIERAIRAFEAVSAVRPRSDFEREYRIGRDPKEVRQRARDWVSLQINIGTAYELRVRGERAQNLRRALAAYEAALQVCRVGFGTDMARQAAARLGSVWAELQDWEGAYAAFRTSLQATGREFNFALTEGRKRSTIEENEWLYERAVESCMRMNPPRLVDALLFAEEARSRIFRYQLSELQLRPPRGVPGGLVAVEQQLLRRMRELQVEINRTVAGETRWRLIDEATATRVKLRQLWDTFRHKHEAADYLALRADEELRWEEFRQWFRGAT